ncbi:MAG TPA: SRPBCC family protein [Gemmatimonadales bacterium]
MKPSIDPKLDLVLERHADVAPAQVWKAWTTPDSLVKWFAPRPWTITECELDLRPGGQLRFVMRSPEGQLYPNIGCYLEVEPNRRLVWTDALLPGYRPAAEPFFTAVVLMESDGKAGTNYTAIALHRDEDNRKKHEAMGFHQGWGQVFDQMVEHIKAKR